MTLTVLWCVCITQEIRALGYANIVGALFNCYTTTGSFSRSAVNNSCGAQSRAQQKFIWQTVYQFRHCGIVQLTCHVLCPVFNEYTLLMSCFCSTAEISSLVTGVFVMVVLLCLTQVFLYMPNNAQGAIIISGIITLFDYKCAAAPAATCCLGLHPAPAAC